MENILFRHQNLDDLRAACRTSHRQQYRRLLAQAGSYRQALPPAEHPSRSITYIGMAAANLSLAYLLSGEQLYIDTLRDWLRIAEAYPHWGKERMPDQDLDAAWLLFGLGLAYNWVGAALPPAERQALHDKLLLQGARLFDHALATEGRWWRSAYWQNHNWICFAGLATAAYALHPENPETRSWAELALQNFQIVFDVLPEDGSDSEGVVYWCYGVLWLLVFAELAAEHEGIDFSAVPFLRNTFYFRLYMSGPNLVDTANFGDCHDRRSAHSRAMLYWFARRLGIGHAQWLAEHFEQTGEWAREAREGLLLPGLNAQAFLDLLWYDPTVETQPLDALPLSRTFPDLGLVSVRTSWHTDALFWVFKSGVPLGRKAWSLAHDLLDTGNWDAVSGGHLHPDENSFILVRGEDYLAVDDGYSKAKQTIQHNTILVNGRGQYLEGVYHVAKGLDAGWGASLDAVDMLAGVVYARGEAAGAYPPDLGLISVARQALFCDGDMVLLHDNLVAEGPRQFDWLLQTDIAAEPVGTGRFDIVTGSSRLGLEIILPAEFTVKHLEQEIVAVPSSAEPEYMLRRKQHTLVVSSGPAPSARFFAVLTAGDRAQAPPGIEQLDCGRGLGVRILWPDRQVLAGFAGSARFWGQPAGFGTDAPWLALTAAPGGRLLRLAVGPATRTYIQGQLWCAAASPTAFSYQEDGWHVRAAASGWVSLRIPKGAVIGPSSAAVSASVRFGMTRLNLPAGESVIRFVHT